MTGYVDWVERVLTAAIAAKQVSRGPVFATMVARELGFPGITLDDFNPRHGAPEAVLQGLGDLSDLTVLEFNNLTSIVVGQLAEDVALTGLRREAWPVAFESPLNEPTVAFLEGLVALSEQHGESFAWLTWHEAKEVFERLNMPTADFDAMNATTP